MKYKNVIIRFKFSSDIFFQKSIIVNLKKSILIYIINLKLWSGQIN